MEQNDITLIAPSGSTVGSYGGFMQGGGFCILTSYFGLMADQVLSMEVVTADGRFVHADPDENEDQEGCDECWSEKLITTEDSSFVRGQRGIGRWGWGLATVVFGMCERDAGQNNKVGGMSLGEGIHPVHYRRISMQFSTNERERFWR